MGNDQLQEKYQAFIRNSSEGIWLFETDSSIPTNLPPAEQVKLMFERGYLADANDAMARMYGCKSAAELIGTRLPDMMVQTDPRNIAYLTAFVESGYRLQGTESHEKDKDGNDRIFRNSLVGIVEDGLLSRVWGTQVDVTAQYAMTRQLQEGQDRLSLALRASGTGLWEWNVLTGELIWSDIMKQLFGMAPNEPITYEKYMARLHQEDRSRLQKIIRQSMKTGEEYKVEHRTVWPDGSEHWILGMGRAILEDG
ncbi:MAG: PAS domain-containing protein, partial [Bacteroidota bacterium]